MREHVHCARDSDVLANPCLALCEPLELRAGLLVEVGEVRRLALLVEEDGARVRGDVGEARETIPVPFAGEPLEIGFNPEFMRDGLEAVETGDVLLRLISPLRPGLLESADGSGFQYLLMPIRLNV